MIHSQAQPLACSPAGTMRRDHYVPRFILNRFRMISQGKVYFAEKGEGEVRLAPVRDIFYQDHGERTLAKPPRLRQRGGTAILASAPEWTESASEALQKREDKWARAIRGMIKWSKNLDNSQTIPKLGFIEVKRGPDRQEEWVQEVVDYCLRTMFRSEEVGDELWGRRQGNEEQDLRKWIEKELGKCLTASDELLNVYRQHNRAKTRTGALVDEQGIFGQRNPEFTIAIWRIVDNTRFIIGSRGGCWVEHGDQKVFLFPVDPKIAVSLAGRRQANEIVGRNVLSGNPRIVMKHDIPGRTGITARIVNKSMWSSCNAVAGLEKRDVEEAIRG